MTPTSLFRAILAIVLAVGSPGIVSPGVEPEAHGS